MLAKKLTHKFLTGPHTVVCSERKGLVGNSDQDGPYVFPFERLYKIDVLQHSHICPRPAKRTPVYNIGRIIGGVARQSACGTINPYSKGLCCILSEKEDKKRMWAGEAPRFHVGNDTKQLNPSVSHGLDVK